MSTPFQKAQGGEKFDMHEWEAILDHHRLPITVATPFTLESPYNPTIGKLVLPAAEVGAALLTSG